MKTTEILTKSDKELQQLVVSTREQIASAHVAYRTSHVANVKQLRGLKRQLARALTIVRQREIAAATAAVHQPATASATPAKTETKS